MKLCFVTLGCRTNEAETRYMASECAKMGFEVSLNLEKADIYVLNTCSITQAADAKSRQLVSRVLKLNNKAKIFVCGCSSEYDKNAFNQPNVKKVYGTKDKYELLNLLKKLIKNKPETTLNLPVRKLVKIQDGCNQFCSYCIVPYLRNNVCSRPINEVVNQINESLEPEINITGINLFLYQQGLTNLMEVLKNSNKRIRLGSLDPRIVDKKFLKALKKIKNFCPQFHLSVQSLSNNVLKNMNRHYTSDEVIKKIKLIRKFFKNAFVACDIIVGFPCETESDFLTTLNLAKQIKFSYMHIFPYSIRKGTKAEKLKQVVSQVKTNRAKQLGEVNLLCFENYKKRFINKIESVLIEEVKEGFSIGHTKNYIKCYIDNNLKVGSIVNVKLMSLKNDGMLAKVLDK